MPSSVTTRPDECNRVFTPTDGLFLFFHRGAGASGKEKGPKPASQGLRSPISIPAARSAAAEQDADRGDGHGREGDDQVAPLLAGEPRLPARGARGSTRGLAHRSAVRSQ